MQESGKSSANGSGPNPALDADTAEELAAAFRPAWDVDDESDALAAEDPPEEKTAVDAPLDAAKLAAMASPATAATMLNGSGNGALHVDPPAPAPAKAEPPAVIISQVITLAASPAEAVPAPIEARAPAPSTQEIESGAILEVTTAPVRAPSAVPDRAAMGKTMRMDSAPPSVSPTARAEKPASRPPPAPKAAPMKARDPFAASFPASARGVRDDDEIVPKKSGKGILLGIGAVVVVAGLGLFLKFALSDDTPKTPTAPPPTTAAAATTQDIPPPTPTDDTPAPTAATTATPPVAKADTTAVTPPPPTPPRRETTPAPAARPEPPRPRPAAARPPAPPSQPKTPPKGNSGGIVRDNPF